MTNENEIFDWLSLARTENIGPVTFFGLLAKYGNCKTALKAISNSNYPSARRYKIPAPNQIENEIKKTLEFGGKFILAKSDEYPKLLNELRPPPPIIVVAGNLSLLKKPSIAIVGARNASGAGMKMAFNLASELSQSDYVITSGLARGIDTSAHQAALKSGTIAVVAGGIDYIYPPENAKLYHEIREYGLIVSENAFGAPVFARDFPRRNRIISGLSQGVIVVEAEAKSGSLITAHFANEQGREVMAVPGSPLDARARGTNGLIREGATLIENASDVLSTLNSFKRISESEKIIWVNERKTIEIDKSTKDFIKQLLSPTPISMDSLADITSLPWRTIAAVVVELELEGFAQMNGAHITKII